MFFKLFVHEVLVEHLIRDSHEGGDFPILFLARGAKPKSKGGGLGDEAPFLPTVSTEDRDPSCSMGEDSTPGDLCPRVREDIIIHRLEPGNSPAFQS